MTPKSACPYQQRFHFNSHAHVERDKNTYITLHWYKNFNSHAHVERDDAECVRRGLIKISTHTLTWSVTFPILFCKVRILISTHTLTWSVTDKRTKQTRYQFISTHTLTWSVTMNTFKSNALKEFQLTRSRGAWLGVWDFEGIYTISTHTLTWSVTFRTEIGDRQRCHFNSHAHVERDKTRTVNNLIAEISTHTLTWSVTERWRNKIWWDCNFNSHAHVERDHLYCIYTD